MLNILSKYVTQVIITVEIPFFFGQVIFTLIHGKTLVILISYTCVFIYIFSLYLSLFHHCLYFGKSLVIQIIHTLWFYLYTLYHIVQPLFIYFIILSLLLVCWKSSNPRLCNSIFIFSSIYFLNLLII